MSDSLKKIISVAIFIVVATVVFIFSYECIWAGDDIAYQYVINNESYYNPDTEEINTIGDVIRSQNVHYTMVNGRYVAHCLVQLYCGILGKALFAVSNALIYIVFIVALMKLIGIKLRDVAQVATLTLLVMLAFDTKYVPSCQIGFIWMFTLAIIWLNLFFKVKQCKWWQCVCLFLFSCVVGNGQEALMVGVVGAVAIDTIKNRKEYNNAKCSMIVGLVIGLAILVFAPPTSTRIENNIVSWQDTISAFIRYSWVFWIALGVIVYLRIRLRVSIRKLYAEQMFYINAAILLIAMNFYIGIYGNRQLFGLYLMSIIILINALPLRSFSKIGIAIMLIIVSSHYIDKWNVIEINKRMYEQVVTEFNRSKDGTIYFDLEGHVRSCNSSPYMANRFTFDIDMVKYQLSRESGWTKSAVVLPSCVKNIDEPVLRDSVVRSKYGNYVFIMSDSSDMQFRIKRCLDFGIAQIPISDYIVDRTITPIYKGDTYMVAVIYKGQPFVKHLSVETIE